VDDRQAAPVACCPLEPGSDEEAPTSQVAWEDRLHQPIPSHLFTLEGAP
jgi:hypothetical protein